MHSLFIYLTMIQLKMVQVPRMRKVRAFIGLADDRCWL